MTWFGKSFQILLPAQTHMLQFKKKKEEEEGGGGAEIKLLKKELVTETN